MLRLPVVLTLTLALGYAAPAVAQEPVYTTTPLYFSCKAPTPVHNNFGAMGFTAAKPTASFAAGAGCGFFDQSLLVSTVGGGNDLVDAVYEGEFNGPVKSATVELHDLLLTQAESGLLSTVNFTAILEIDGEEVLNTVDTDPPFEAFPTVSSTGLSQSIKFGIDLTKLNLTADVDRTYRLTIGRFYSDTAAAWVGGASEVPAGITFNPSSPAKPTIKTF